jgi:hypothetical protein
MIVDCASDSHQQQAAPVAGFELVFGGAQSKISGCTSSCRRRKSAENVSIAQQAPVFKSRFEFSAFP